jgi:hypothetical protein
MNKQIQNIVQPQVLSGIAICSSAALGAYSIKNILEINKKLDIIVSEINTLKSKSEENKKRNNISTSSLTRKIEELNQKLVSKTSEKVLELVEDENEDEDDISEAVNNFLKN